jgi:hypothetical protein
MIGAFASVHLRNTPWLLRADSCRRATLTWRKATASIRQHTSAYVSIRQHSSAFVSIRQHTSAYVRIRQHMSAYVSIRQHTSAYVSMRQHTSAYVSIRQHASPYVSIRLRLAEGLREEGVTVARGKRKQIHFGYLLCLDNFHADQAADLY